MKQDNFSISALFQANLKVARKICDGSGLGDENLKRVEMG
jgi:hypothetical protein